MFQTYIICILLFKHFPSIKSNLSLQLHMLIFPTRRHVFALSVPVHCWCVSHISFNSLPATIKQFRQNQWRKSSYKFNRRIKCIARSSFRSCFPKQKIRTISKDNLIQNIIDTVIIIIIIQKLFTWNIHHSMLYISQC